MKSFPILFDVPANASFVKLRDASHEALFKQKMLQGGHIQQREKQLDNPIQRLREVLEDHEGIQKIAG